MRNNNIRQDKEGNYYQLDEMALKEFDANQKSSGGGKTKAPTAAELKKDKSWQEIKKGIFDMKVGGTGDFVFDGRKVSYDGANFIIQTGMANKDIAIDTKENVIKYLETGAYTPDKK
jgi:hypothetical protein